MEKKTIYGQAILRSFDLKKPSVKLLYYVMVIICVIAVFISFAPILWVILSSFKDIKEFAREATIIPKMFNFSRIFDTWNDLKFITYYRNSLFSVLGSVICAIFFNGLLAFSLIKLRPAGSRFIFMLILWSLLIPATTSIVPLFMNLTKIGLSGSLVPLWFSAGANAFYVILYRNFYQSIPEPLMESARLDGCSNMQTFFLIIVPLSSAINMVIIIYAVNAAWSDFLLPYLLLNNSEWETVMVRLFQFRGSRASDVEILRAIVFAVIPPIILFGFFQKYITHGAMSSGIKG